MITVPKNAFPLLDCKRLVLRQTFTLPLSRSFGPETSLGVLRLCYRQRVDDPTRLIYIYGVQVKNKAGERRESLAFANLDDFML